MYSVEEVNDRSRWDDAVRMLPGAHILQSWAWTETKAQTGWRAHRMLWSAGGRPAAAAALLTRRLAQWLPVSVAYIPKGPVMDWNDAALVGAVLQRVQEQARRRRVIFVKVDPDVRSDTPAGEGLCANLTGRGWRRSEEQIQYRNTIVTDLAPSEDALLAGMKPKWRYNIRLAERRGVVVRDGATADLPVFYRIYVETGERDGFLVRPYSYYESIWSQFMSEGLAHLLLAELEGRCIAGLMLFRYGETAWYFYGASTAVGRDAMPNHALQWAALRYAKASGCTRYDWWGAPDTLEEGDPMMGVYRFKAGFGGEFVPWIGAWDYPANRPLYWLYGVAMPRLLDLARRRHRTGQPAP